MAQQVTIPQRGGGPQPQQPAARMKFYVDAKRCIECGGCEVACKNENNVPYGIARIRVVTLNEGEPGETNIAVPCMQCSKAPCIAVCPVDALYQRPDGIVALNKETCIGCGYCLYACPFGAPQFPKGSPFGARGVMDKCTYCSGGPEVAFSERERRLYGSNRIAEGKLPCARRCVPRRHWLPATPKRWPKLCGSEWQLVERAVGRGVGTRRTVIEEDRRANRAME